MHSRVFGLGVTDATQGGEVWCKIQPTKACCALLPKIGIALMLSNLFDK